MVCNASYPVLLFGYNLLHIHENKEIPIVWHC